MFLSKPRAEAVRTETMDDSAGFVATSATPGASTTTYAPNPLEHQRNDEEADPAAASGSLAQSHDDHNAGPRVASKLFSPMPALRSVLQRPTHPADARRPRQHDPTAGFGVLSGIDELETIDDATTTRRLSNGVNNITNNHEDGAESNAGTEGALPAAAASRQPSGQRLRSNIVSFTEPFVHEDGGAHRRYAHNNSAGNNNNNTNGMQAESVEAVWSPPAASGLPPAMVALLRRRAEAIQTTRPAKLRGSTPQTPAALAAAAAAAAPHPRTAPPAAHAQILQQHRKSLARGTSAALLTRHASVLSSGALQRVRPGANHNQNNNNESSYNLKDWRRSWRQRRAVPIPGAFMSDSDHAVRTKPVRVTSRTILVSAETEQHVVDDLSVRRSPAALSSSEAK